MFSFVLSSHFYWLRLCQAWSISTCCRYKILFHSLSTSQPRLFARTFVFAAASFLTVWLLISFSSVSQGETPLVQDRAKLDKIRYGFNLFEHIGRELIYQLNRFVGLSRKLSRWKSHYTSWRIWKWALPSNKCYPCNMHLWQFHYRSLVIWNIELLIAWPMLSNIFMKQCK